MMMNISLNWQTVLVGVCFGLLSYYVIKRLNYRLPPGPWCVPIIGNVQGQLKVNGNGIETHLNRLYLRFSILKHYKTIFYSLHLAGPTQEGLQNGGQIRSSHQCIVW